MIPRVIHQTWKDHAVPLRFRRFREAQESFRRDNWKLLPAGAASALALRTLL